MKNTVKKRIKIIRKIKTIDKEKGFIGLHGLSFLRYDELKKFYELYKAGEKINAVKLNKL